jgi:glutamyl-tRNA synthetase
MRLVPLVRSRISILSDLGPLTAPFFSGVIEMPTEQLLEGKLDRDAISVALELALARAEGLEWKKTEIERMLKGIAEQMDFKFRDFLRPFFVAIMGSPVSVPLFDAMETLGRDLCRARLRQALGLVGKPQSEEKRRWLRTLQENGKAGSTLKSS